MLPERAIFVKFLIHGLHDVGKWDFYSADTNILTFSTEIWIAAIW